MEVWLDVPLYEGIYKASSNGRIKSLCRKITKGAKTRTMQERILKQYINGDGYYDVKLSNNHPPKTYKAHRVICSAFHPNPENKRTVNHIDGNKLNNHKDNLEWATDMENSTHAWKMGLSKPTRWPNKRLKGALNPMSHKIAQYTRKGELIAARELNISHDRVMYSLKEAKKPGKYNFRYLNQHSKL